MDSAEVLIKFKADTSDVDKATKTMTDKLSSNMTSAAKSIAPYSAAATGFITAVSKTGIEFEKSMANVQAISGATTDDMKKLSEKAREMGKSTIYSASESADALSYMALAGWKTEDMLEGLPGILNLAAAGNTDLATTSDIVTDNLTAFGKSAQDSTQLADIMAATMSNSNTTIELLGESFKYCASVAGAMNYSMEDTSLALGLMANAGIKGSQAGTALRSMLTRMAKPTEESQAAMDKLGISLTDAEGNMKPLKTILGELRTGMSNLTESEQAQYAAMLGGKPAMSGILAMANSGAEDFDKLANAIDGSTGTAQNMADVMNKSTANQLKIMWSEVQELALQFAQFLLPVIKTVIGFFTNLAKTFQKLSGPAKIVISIIAGIIAVATPLLLIVAKMIGVWKKVKPVISGVVKVVKLLNSALLSNPIFLIIAAVVALIAIGVMLYNKCEGFRNFIDGWVNGFKILIAGVVNFLKAAADVIINAFKFAIGVFVSMITNCIAVVKGVISAAIEVFKFTFITIPTWIYNTVIKPIVNFFSSLWNGFVNGAKGAWNGIKSVFSTVVSFFKNTFSNAWNAIKGLFSAGGKLFEGIKDGVVSVFKTVVNGLISGINTIVAIPFKTINGLLNTIRNVKIPVINKKPFKGLWKQDPLPVPKIPKLATGTNEVPDDMLAMIHKGEAVVPKKFNPYSNMSSSMLGIMKNSKQNQVINVYASFKQDSLGQTVRDIKTFSGGARNDYNYGVGV